MGKKLTTGRKIPLPTMSLTVIFSKIIPTHDPLFSFFSPHASAQKSAKKAEP